MATHFTLAEVLALLYLVVLWVCELLEFADGTLGLALNLESRTVGAVRFAKPMGDSSTCVEGSIVRTTRSVANIAVGPAYRGRIVNALGSPMDGLGALESDTQERRSLESPAPSILDRRSVHEPFATVLFAEMLAGLALVKDLSTVVVVMAGADEAATLQYLAPYTGATIAEYFMYQGEATCSVYDDLTKHAISYREMCLLLRRPPAREAYPGDVFYLHARLLERGAKLSDACGSGLLKPKKVMYLPISRPTLSPLRMVSSSFRPISSMREFGPPSM